MPGFLSKLINNISGGSIVKDVIEGADKLFTSKEEKLEFQRLMEEAERKHKEQLIRMAMDAEQQYLADRQSAREMQKEALQQNDLFSKRFVYILAILILISAMAFGATLLWVEIPDENRRMIEMFADIFIFTGAITVVNFFFGSSRGSDDKNAMIRKNGGDK